MTNLPKFLYQVYNNTTPIPAILKSREDARNLKRALEADVEDSSYHILRVTVDRSSSVHVR